MFEHSRTVLLKQQCYSFDKDWRGVMFSLLLRQLPLQRAPLQRNAAAVTTLNEGTNSISKFECLNA
jgi:hypothetical protein